MLTRNEILQSLRENPQGSVLITGGGINGIGTFRDLALQGVDCLLVERGDFCSGASMASSHMLHGGIRYLENGEFRLVKEALHERNNLLRNAPHLTHPLPTTIPIFKWFSGIFNAPLKFIGLLNKPAERGAVIIKLGLILYDAYVRGDSPMPSHSFDGRKSALRRWPELNPEVRFAATYYDGGMVSPERLALEILLDGESEGEHARALNYVSAAGRDGNSVLLRDELSGEVFPFQPRVVVNAGGPWIDQINQQIAGDTQLIGGTKGSHLIVRHPELYRAIGGHEIFFEYIDGRIVLIFPYQEGLVMIGTTDLRIEDPDQAVCTEEEIEYILGMVPQIFPNLRVTRDQVVFQFSGVRPLPSAKGSTGQISRDHAIETYQGDLPWPVLSLVGGKWTSYRAFSEQTTDRVLDLLDKNRRSSTKQLRIGGGLGFPSREAEQQAWVADLARKSGLALDRAQTLFSRYGTRAAKLVSALSGSDDPPLQTLDGYTRGEIIWLVRSEKITRLDDLLLRRTKIAWVGRATRAVLEELAAVAGEQLGWSAGEQNAEVDRAARLLKEKHALKL